jgi:nitrite reductase/ring-hydroxylating ferredoxin subunit
MTTTHAPTRDDDDCGADDCTLLGQRGPRREFLRGAGAALGALALLGLSGEEAMALPVRLLRGTRDGSGAARFPIPADDSVIFDDANGIILVRRGPAMWAFLTACPHKEVVKIKWKKDENRFQCPKHDSRYQADGTFIDGKATRNLDRLPIKKDGAQVVVDVDTVYQSDKNTELWKAAVAAL